VPITIDYDRETDKLRVNIVKSEDFNFDKDRIRRIPTRSSKFDKASGKFLYWQIDRSEICSILDRFNEKEIIATPAVKQFIENYKTASALPEDLEKIDGEIDSLRIPKVFQEDFIRLHESKRRMIFAADPGLGKSFCAIERAEILGTIDRMLIVCPKIMLPNWRTELRLTRDKPCLIYHGTVKQRKKLQEQLDTATIVVTTYEMVGEINHHQFKQVIIDEAHLVSRNDTKKHKDLQELDRNNPNAAMLLLTGTPILHKIVDLWGLVHLVAPEIAGSKWAWQNRYEEVVRSIQKTLPSGRVLTIPIKTRTKNLDDLRKRLAGIMVRVRRNKFTTYKELTTITTVAMTPKQKEMYKQVREGIVLELQNARFWDSKNVLTRALGLREISEAAFNMDPTVDESGKFDYVCHILDQAIEDGRKVVIWSSFREMTNRLYEKYKQHGVLFNGGVSDTRKKLAPWAFQGVSTEEDRLEYLRLRKYNPDWTFAPGEALFFFGTLDHRQGLGINLDVADYQLFTSWHPNFVVERQAIDRLCRLTQTKDVTAEFVVSEDSIDHYLLKMSLENYTKTTDALDGIDSISSNQAREIAKLVLAGKC
jgi:SNF2 family DNA or RNA helicase